jgi:hypothetical protein
VDVGVVIVMTSWIVAGAGMAVLAAWWAEVVVFVLARQRPSEHVIGVPRVVTPRSPSWQKAPGWTTPARADIDVVVLTTLWVGVAMGRDVDVVVLVAL